MDHIGKKNITMSPTDWKIIMFDHKGVKTMNVIWILSIFFIHIKSENCGHEKNMKCKGYNMYNQNQFKAFQNTFYQFLNEPLMYPPKDSMYLRLISKSRNTKESKICNVNPCTKS